METGPTHKSKLKKSLSEDEHGTFEEIVQRLESDQQDIPEEYAALTAVPSQEELYREALNPQQASSEEWRELDQSDKQPSPYIENREDIERRLLVMKKRYQETQAMLPPYEYAPIQETIVKKPPILKRIAGFFNRRKGSNEAWHPEQRVAVATLAKGAVAAGDFMVQFNPDYPSRRFNPSL